MKEIKVGDKIDSDHQPVEVIIRKKKKRETRREGKVLEYNKDKKGEEGFRDKLRNVEKCEEEIKTERKEMEKRIQIALKTKIKKERKENRKRE